MDEAPQIPQPVPEVPRKALWISLALPPAATLLGNLLAAGIRHRDDYGITFLGVPVLVLFLILGFLFMFKKAVGTRYRGRSLVYLNIAYFLGQIIVCLALWVGSCLLFVK